MSAATIRACLARVRQPTRLRTPAAACWVWPESLHTHPCAHSINIFRDPRWGRGQETPGEDPFLSGVYATRFVIGMQGSPSMGAEDYLLVSACLKHFAAYSAEAEDISARIGFVAAVTAQDMRDTFLPAFREGVESARASGLMCSYNSETFGAGSLGPGSKAQLGSVPSCANRYLLNDLARGEWKFDGYVTTDCGVAVGLGAEGHGYTHGPQEVIAAMLGAGVDTSCVRTRTAAPLALCPPPFLIARLCLWAA